MTKTSATKKIIYLLVMTVVLSSMVVGTVSASSNLSNSTVSDSGVQKLLLVQEDFIQNNKYLTDKEKVERLIKTFFIAKEANYKEDNGDIDLSSFLYSLEENKFNITKITNKNKLEKEIRKGVNGKIIWDNLETTVNDISITGNIAKAVVYENYQYVLDNYDSGFSSRGINYEIELTNYDNKWLISKLSSNDELEKGFWDKDSDVDAILKKIMTNSKDPLDSKALEREIQVEKEEAQKNNRNLTTQVLLTFVYDGSEASSYATTYTNSSGSTSDSSPYNSKFSNYNPNDCQNYASQCVWFGFGALDEQDYIDLKSIPMVDTGSRLWYNTSTHDDCTNSWVNCASFATYISNGGSTVEGPSGTINTNNLSYAKVGDTIQIYNGSSWYHTYIVNAVTGTSGSRTNSNIWVCAHTANRNNQRLDTIIGNSQNNTRNIRIGYAYYE